MGIIGMYIRHFVCHNFLYVHDKLKRRGKSKPSAQLILTGMKHSQQRPCHPQYIMFSVTYPEGVRYPETTGRYFKGWCRRYTEQEVGAHICFTAIFQAMERRPQNELRSSSFSSWYGLRGIPEPDWAVKHMCAPTSCSVYLLHHPLKYLPVVSSEFFNTP